MSGQGVHNSTLSDGAGFIFWMPIIYGVITIYLLIIMFMVSGGADKSKVMLRLAIAIAMIIGSYTFITTKYGRFIHNITHDANTADLIKSA